MMHETLPLLSTVTTTDPAHATLRIRSELRSPHRVSRYITGKFCEHLHANISNGMHAQILRNPTFAAWPFYANDNTSPDGGAVFHCDPELISAELRRYAERWGWPAPELAPLATSYADGLAAFWTREGMRETVQVSPDAGSYGGRAQRVEIQHAGDGIAQWTFLPLHRTRSYAYQIAVRSPDLSELSLTLWAADTHQPVAQSRITNVSAHWQTFAGSLELEASAPDDALYKLAVTAPEAGQFVVAHILLLPSDHIDGADPDVVRLLKASRLPILRWPGGNFVSGYHWEDGIGPLDRRPTRPNPAWGEAEPNFFGTDEFIAFCRAVGCEPMICVNAGDGTPEEAARWVEYCNGPVDTPMGARRAANGHPTPHNVRHWEIGNELWGRWQVSRTTPAGYSDRYRQFFAAMLAADPTITLYACGAPVLWGQAWNETLFREHVELLQHTTDHVLLGGTPLAPTTEPLDVYRDFMAFPLVLEQKYRELWNSMHAAGIREPRLAITELQLFAHLAQPAGAGGTARLTRETLVDPATLAEALYDVLLYHMAVRLAPFVEMVTHSATVNHGGGLRKEHERVYANPCYYAQAAFAAFAGATPLAVELAAPVERPAYVLSDLQGVGLQVEVSALDALAALAEDGALLLSLVHRGTAGPIHLTVDLHGFEPAPHADVWTLTADVPWAANTLADPHAVVPAESRIATVANKLSLDVQPYTVLRIRVPRSAE